MTGINQSRLETNRVDELDVLLTQLKPLILKHISTTEAEGSKVTNNYSPQQLETVLLSKFSIDSRPSTSKLDDIISLFQTVLENSVVTWHPGFLDKLYASTNPIGVVSDLLLSLLNTNSHVYKVSPLLTVIEKTISKRYASLFGFTGEYSGGLTFPGGSWSNVTSLHVARSILHPDTKLNGNSNHKFAIFTSKHSHYSVEKAAILLGLGSSNVFKVDVNSKGEMIVSDLQQKIEIALQNGFEPLYVNATAGTTVFGSFDPLNDIATICKKYNLWFHVDASWGGNVIFSSAQRYKLDGIHLANSITSNPHKLLGVPATCSFLLLPDERTLKTANSLNAPYLFHHENEAATFYDLADGTMGCGRRADSLKFYMSWYFYGSKGYEERIDHAFTISNHFYKRIKSNDHFKLVIEDPQLTQICFYYNKNKEFSDPEINTETTRSIAQTLKNNGRFLIDYSPAEGVPYGEFFRLVFISPILTTDFVDELYDQIVQIGNTL